MMKPLRRRAMVLAGLVAGTAVGGLWWSLRAPEPTETIFEPDIAPVESAAICPWRNPEADLAKFFPGADRWTIESLILSSLIVDLEESLGRWLTPEENPLRRHRVWQNGESPGAVLTHRLRGEHGAIEIVLAVDERDHVRGVGVQRMREPLAIAAVLTNASWLAAFNGRSATNAWQLGRDVPDVPSEARLSARTIVHGVRDLLLLNQAARTAPQPEAHLHPEQ